MTNRIQEPQLGLFITPETREAIKLTAKGRDRERIKEISEHLHKELDKCLKMIAVNEITGRDFIIYTPERQIGKTRALLKLCDEYKAVYITTNREKGILEHEARELGYTEMPFMTPAEREKLAGLRVRTVIKSECVKIEDAREALGKAINIIGIEEI